nr:Gap3.2 [Starmerella bombicola]
MQSEKVQSNDGSSDADTDTSGNITPHPVNIITPHSAFIDAFKPSSFKRPTDFELGIDTSQMTHIEKAQYQLSRGGPTLSRRHLILVTASAGIGTGLFIGTGNTLPQAGPAGLIISFGLMSLCLTFVMISTAELNLRYPTVNPMSQLAARFLDPSWGFTVGWIYMFGYMVSAPLEIIAGAEVTQYWHNDNNSAAKVNPVAWVAIIYVFDVCVHLFGGSRGYGELESFIGAIKVLAVLGFIIFTIIHVAGGIPGPDHHYIGAKYFDNPGAFTSAGFKGVLSAWVSSSFAYGGTEVSGLAAAESANPLRAIPSSTKQTFWRSLILFLVPVILIGFSVPYDDPNIGSSNSGSGSPFVRSIQMAGVRALPSIFNAVIMCSTIGVSNSSMYACNRSLVALSLSGWGPKFLSYVDRRGRPVLATLCTLTFSLLCFVAASSKYNDVFNWLYAFAQLAYLFVWASICLVHIKFRLVMRRQGRSLKELLYVSPFGIIGALIGGGIAIVIFVLQFWSSASPVIHQNDRAAYFFQSDLSVPVAIALFVGHKIYTRKTTGNWGFVGWNVDLDRGVRLVDLDELHEQEEMHKEHLKRNKLLRIADFLC